MSYAETQRRVQAALEEDGAQVINSDAFFAACDKHDIEPGDLEDAIAECGIQADDDRSYDHWGSYDR